MVAIGTEIRVRLAGEGLVVIPGWAQTSTEMYLCMRVRGKEAYLVTGTKCVSEFLEVSIPWQQILGFWAVDSDDS